MNSELSSGLLSFTPHYLNGLRKEATQKPGKGEFLEEHKIQT